MLATSYTEKHLALAEHLNIEPFMIENENDEIFYIFDAEENDEKEMWVLTKEEASKQLNHFIAKEMEMPFYSFKLSFVAEALGVAEEDVKEYFLPEILLNEIRFDDGWIDTPPLRRYVEDKFSVYFFVHSFCKFVIETDSSGEFLCNKMRETVVNGFHIYYRY